MVNIKRSIGLVLGGLAVGIVGTKTLFNIALKKAAERRQGLQIDYTFDDAVFDTEEGAKETLSQMEDLLNKFGNVTVADLCDTLGLTPGYKDNEYGWTDISNAYVKKTLHGYMLKLPTPISL